MKRITVWIYGLCAFIWSVRAFLEVIHKTYTKSVFWFCMNLFCAVLWVFSFCIVYKRYCSNKDGQN